MQGRERTPQPRVVVLEGVPGEVHMVAEHEPALGKVLTIGRHGDVVIGVRPSDAWLSSVAVEIVYSSSGWDVRINNRNGAFVHGWGQPARRAHGVEWLRRERVGLRVVGGPSRQYWVLLERGEEPDGAMPGMRTNTLERAPVRPLTSAQQEALRELFRDLLAWPPVVPAGRERLDAVAARLGVSISAIQARLEDARAKAEDLGLVRRVPLNDPEYLYVLVRAGYLSPEPAVSGSAED